MTFPVEKVLALSDWEFNPNPKYKTTFERMLYMDLDPEDVTDLDNPGVDDEIFYVGSSQLF